MNKHQKLCKNIGKKNVEVKWNKFQLFADTINLKYYAILKS